MRFLIIVLLCFRAWPLFSQEQVIDTPRVSVFDEVGYRLTVLGLRYQQGSVLIHSKALANLKRTYPRGAEFDISRQFVTKKAWDFCRCAPRLGVANTFWDYDLPSILGYGAAAVAYVEPVYTPFSRLHASVRLGMGLSWLSLPYDSITNPGNNAYSLYWGFPLIVNFGLNYSLSPHWNVRLAANFNHVSNGGIREPNKGLNYPSLALSADYSLQEMTFVSMEKTKREKPAKRGRLYLTYLNAVSNDKPGGEKQFYIFGGSVVYSRYIAGSSALAIGTEVVRDLSLRMRILRTDDHDRSEVRAAILAGHDFWLGRITFGIHMGIYYLDQWKMDDPVYQRYTLTVQPFPKSSFFTGIGVKTHLHRADFTDVRVGWIF